MDAGENCDDALLKSVMKALAVMECFSPIDRQLSVGEIARRTGMPRGTVHRIALTLRTAGLMEQECERDKYRLGIKLFELGTVVLNSMDLYREARSFIEALTSVSGEIVYLCVFDGMRATIIKRTEPDRDRTNTIVTMEASPAHCTASGKAVLAFQPDSVITRVLAMGLNRYTPRTIVDPKALLAELVGVRKKGYAIDDEELAPGIRCVGAPIRNASARVFASLSISGPTHRLTRAKIAAMAELAMHYAEAISAQLGYRRPLEREDAPALGTGKSPRAAARVRQSRTDPSVPFGNGTGRSQPAPQPGSDARPRRK